MTSSFLSHGQFLMSDNLWFSRNVLWQFEFELKNSQISVVAEQEALECSVALDLLIFMLYKLHFYIII